MNEEYASGDAAVVGLLKLLNTDSRITAMTAHKSTFFATSFNSKLPI
jgi:hypothetical protein